MHKISLCKTQNEFQTLTLFDLKSVPC